MAGAASAGPTVRVEPDRLEDVARPLHVEVRPLDADQTARFELRPQCAQGVVCPAIAATVNSARDGDRVTATVDLASARVRKNESLVLRTFIDGPGGAASVDSVVGIAKRACTLMRAILDTFTGASCADGFAIGLAGMHYGAEANSSTPWSILVHDDASSSVLASTAGATGVAWLDDATLVFTSTGPPLTTADIAGGIDAPRAGLYAVKTDGTQRRLLVDTDGAIADAPFVHADGRISMLVRGDAGQPPVLWTLAGEQVERLPLDAALAAPVEAIAASRTATGDWLLVDANLGNPVLASIDRRTGHVVYFPHDRSVATMTRPPLQSGGWPIATLGLDRNATSTYIARIDAQGRLVDELARGHTAMAMPVVAPDRKRFAALTR